jgi:hypothetical protein
MTTMGGGTTMTPYSHCHECRQKLGHVALFCPHCGGSACSRVCQAKHRDRHDRTSKAVAPSVGEARPKTDAVR